MKITMDGAPRWHWRNLRFPSLILASSPAVSSCTASGPGCSYLIILSPLLFALVHRTMLAEERQLEKRPGDGYRAYKKQVRRYL